MCTIIDRYALSAKDKIEILKGSLLTDIHIDKFHKILRNNSQFNPRSPLLIQNVLKDVQSTRIQPHPRNLQHLQILHSCDDLCDKCLNGHWICSFYDTKSIFIYDSLNQKRLHDSNERFLRKLFPYFDEVPMYFGNVQSQTHAKDCALFAIAYATSIFFNKNPVNIIYDVNLLRPHLYNIFEHNVIIHFPIARNNKNNSVQENVNKDLLLKNCWNKNSLILESNTNILQFENMNRTSAESCNVIGLVNKDISCYANSSLQSLLHCTPIRRKILNDSEINALTCAFYEYLYLKRVNIMLFREFAGNQYAEYVQQDVAEFIMDLCNKSCILQATLQHKLLITRKCITCQETTVSKPDINYILPLAATSTRRHTLQELVNLNIGRWMHTDIMCHTCKRTKFEKVELHTDNTILILQLKLFFMDNDGVLKKNTDFKLKNVENEKVVIDNKAYKVINSIFHHGTSLNCGHYTNMIRKQNHWLKVDDCNVSQASWPVDAKDVYVLFLEQETNVQLGSQIRQQKPIETKNAIKRNNVIYSVDEQNNHKLKPQSILHNCFNNDNTTKTNTETSFIHYNGKRKNKDDFNAKNVNTTNKILKTGTKNNFNNKLKNDKQNQIHSNITFSNPTFLQSNYIKLNTDLNLNSEIGCITKAPSSCTSTDYNNAKMKYLKSTAKNNINELKNDKKIQISLNKTDIKLSTKVCLNVDTDVTGKVSFLKRNLSARNKIEVSELPFTQFSNCKEENVTANKSIKYYRTHADKIQKAKKLYYNLNRDKILEKKKIYYQLNREQACKKSKTQYELQKNEICAKRKEFYYANKEKILSMRKKYYNLNPEQKLIKAKVVSATKVKNKYVSKQNTIKLLQNKEKFITKIMHNLDISDLTKSRMEADNMVLNSIYIRDVYISRIKKQLRNLKDNIEISLMRLCTNSIAGNEQLAIAALCGKQLHTSNSEAFFTEGAYNFDNNVTRKDGQTKDIIVLNEEGQSTNIFPLIKSEKGKKTWVCNSYCKSIDVDILNELKDLFEDLLDLTYVSAFNFLKNIDICSAESRDSNKGGHPNICYMQPLLCKSKFLKLHVLSPHFPEIRSIKRRIYELKNIYANVNTIECALDNGDVDKLKTIVLEINKLAIPLKNMKFEICLDQKEIKKKYEVGIKEFLKIDTDPPKIPCVSCDRLCCFRNVQSISKTDSNILHELLNVSLEENYWNQLLQLYDSQEVNEYYMCKSCIVKLKRYSLPATCILNNLFTKDPPDELKTLNMYEKMLIQRAKAFQTIVKMDTVMKKHLPHYVKIDKCKGRTFHLPLPLEETLKKICPDTDPLNIDHEIYILVRGNPTKNGKLIWEDYVNVKKVWSALHWLKNNNYLYKDILIPTCPQDLLNPLKDLEYEANSEVNSDNNHNNNEIAAKPAALLTQRSQSDPYYDQFSIYPLYGKKLNESDTKLYQMLQVYASGLDLRSKDLDLKCFPDLYPYGRYGQHDDREVRLRDYDFIKCKLTSKHPQFRLNIQYLFYLLFNNTIRQISAGIFHKLNIVNPQYKYTAKELSEKLEQDQLETNLQTIFSRLRGTEAYWRQPRNELNCMMSEYGPATFFITFSPGEWMWSTLGEYICHVNGWKDDKRSISELIAVDPVSASRYIYNKFQAMLAYILSSARPIGKVSHYYYACEYQGRGLPHYHCLFWIEGAPIYGEATNEEVQHFILENISCRIPDKRISPELHRRIETYQQHKHNNYCMRKKKTKTGFKTACRFSFPRPITTQLILRPVSVAIANRQNLKNKSRFYDLPRRKQEQNINDYIPALLVLWEGNMDAQFIGESSYLLTKYVSSYGTKGEKSVVDFTDVQSNKSLHSRLWSFSLQALQHRECGAIEAADALLGHPLHATDSGTVIRWLDIRMIRNRKLKPFHEIKKLPPDSTDIFYDSFIDSHYPKRPESLNSMCLYDFAKWFDILNKKPVRKAEYYEMDDNRYCKKRTKPYLINHWKYNPINQPESYYYGLLLLFQPWRDLDELKGTADTYTNAFFEKYCQLSEAMKYHDKCQIMQEAIDTMNKLIQDQLNNKNENNNETNANNVPEGCVPIETENAMKDFLDTVNKVVVTKQSLEDNVAKFNQDQARVFNKIINTVQSGDKTLRIFVSGSGGTGKSFIINTLVLWNQIVRDKHTAVTAPTGIAAYNIQGLTIHRLLQIPVEQGCTAKYKELSSAALKQIRQSLNNVDLIIIDEISMVSNVILMYIHLRLTEIFNTSDCEDGWFGKKHIIVFGDLLQLPPVHEGFPFVELGRDKIDKYIGAMNAFNLWSLFDYDELIINMRQKSDTLYSQILSRIRLGLIVESDIQALQKRKLNFPSKNNVDAIQQLCEYLDKLPPDTVCLLPTKDMCNVLNTAMLSRISSEEIILVANDSFKCAKNLQKKVLKMLNEEKDNMCGVERTIRIKIGAKIMIRRNIDVTIGVVNGTIGTVLTVTRDKSNNVTGLRVLLQSGKEYELPRLEYKFVIMDKVYVDRQQFPICCSYAITIHKSQGLSLQNAVIEAGNTIFSCGQIYVAMSRVTNIKGLHLINFDPSSITADESAILEYNRLRKTYRPDLQLFQSTPSQRDPRYKVRDTRWTVSKNVLLAQDESSNLNHFSEISITIIGLPNTDRLSCYANACIQSLFHSTTIRRALLQQRKNDHLKNIFNQYISKNIVEIKTLREFVDIKYGKTEQQDAAEFLLELCNKFEILRNTVSHTLSTVTRCPACLERSESKLVNFILTLTLPKQTKVFTLQDIIDYNIGNWRDIEGTCSNNHSSKMVQKIDVTIRSTIVIIKLPIFIVSSNSVSKFTKLQIKDVPKAKIVIKNRQYRVVSGIYQHGSTAKSGYYTNMLRQNNRWIKVSDNNIEPKPWPKCAKDAYIFILEDISL